MFRQDCTCPALLVSNLLSTCTGLSPISARLSFLFQFLQLWHWPSPRSLATTSGVSVDVLSSGYLDVSVLWVCSDTLCIHVWSGRSQGFPHSEILGSKLVRSSPSLSQRTTSFIASQHQGIHKMLLSRLMLSLPMSIRVFRPVRQTGRTDIRSKKDLYVLDLPAAVRSSATAMSVSHAPDSPLTVLSTHGRPRATQANPFFTMSISKTHTQDRAAKLVSGGPRRPDAGSK